MAVHLSTAQIKIIHQHQLANFGGLDGVRDEGLLQSAAASPGANVFGHAAYPDLASMAAAYLYHLAKNHPFVDGNKRTSLQAALVFLDINGMDLGVDEDQAVDMVLAVCENRMSKEELIELFRATVRPL